MEETNMKEKTVKIKYGERKKSTAMVLAVLFGFWAWLYTYRENAWKFWLGLVISVTCWWLFFLPNLAIWIWAMVDNGTKPKEWYDNY